MNENRFTAYKTSVDGNQIKRDFIYDLTIAEIDEFPISLQSDSMGSYVWSWSLTAAIKGEI